MEETKLKISESQKKASIKYREANRDKVNEKRKEYYQKRKEVDPDFLKYKRDKAKEYYQKKKAEDKEKKELIDKENINEIIRQIEFIKENLIEEVKPEVIDTILTTEDVLLPSIEKKKRIYKKKN